MIKNKLVTITKDNQFDKGWSLFQPFNFDISKDRNYKEITVSDVIKLITFSKNINIVLKEPCLSSRIVDEIKWANKYVTINAVVKDQKILDAYSSIKFSKTNIDKNIDFNYIGIDGKECGNFFIIDGFSKTDNLINDVYFNGKKASTDYSFLDDCKKVVLVDSTFEKNYKNIIEEIKKRKIQSYYLINSSSFSKTVLQNIKDLGVEACLSDYTNNGILLEKNDGSLLVLTLLPDNTFSRYYVQNTDGLFREVFRSMILPDNVKTDSLKGDVYSCVKGSLRKMSIAKLKTIELERPILKMEDFINENFDSSIVEEHNEYSAESNSVEYKFTLIPPMIDNTYMESSIYDEVHKLNKDFNSISTLNIEKIKTNYNECLDGDFGLLSFLENSKKFINTFNGFVEKCEYKGFSNVVKKICDLFNETNNSLIDIFSKMFNSINEKSAVNKFDKFDNEIAGYKQTINEKTALINKGVDVLSNKRRVEILSKKIDDLLKLKEQFEGSSSSRNDKATSDFVKLCNDIISGIKKPVNDDSIGNIVRPKEETKSTKLEMFASKYLLSIKKYIDSGLEILNKLCLIKLPEDYKVYDKKGIRYIVINNLDEFELTKAIRTEFKLNCLVRR